MTSQVQQLVDFLGDSRPEVRGVVAQNILQYTGDETMKAQLRAAKAPRALCRLIGDLAPIAEASLKSLINFCDDAAALQQMLEVRLVESLMEGLRDKEFPFKRLAVMLLSNLAQTMEGCLQVLQRDAKGASRGLTGLHFRRLLQWFLTPAASFTDVSEDPFEFAGSIIHNCTQLVEARNIILEPERGILQALLPQLASASVVRRRGTAGALRNCCFELASVEWLLSPTVDILTVLGTPLQGPTPYRSGETASFPPAWTTPEACAAHEPDAATRLLLLEALLLLAGHKPARAAMKEVNMYAVVRNLHYWLEGTIPDFIGGVSASGVTAAGAARSLAEGVGSGGDAAEVSQDSVGASAASSTERANVPAHEGVGDLPPLDEKAADVVNQLVQYLQRDETEGEEGGAGAPVSGGEAAAPSAPVEAGAGGFDISPPASMAPAGTAALAATETGTAAAPAPAAPPAAAPPAPVPQSKPRDGRVESMLDRHVHTVQEPSRVIAAATARMVREGVLTAAPPAAQAEAPPAGEAGDMVDAAGLGGMD